MKFEPEKPPSGTGVMNMSSNKDQHRSASPDVEGDPDLALAIALSLQEENITGDAAVESSPVAAKDNIGKSASAGAAFGYLALDRKTMEEERLARLKKRSAAQAGLNEKPQNPKLRRSEDDILGVSDINGPGPSKTPNQIRETAKLPFSKGAFKRTWAYGYPRTGEDIKIEEILQKDKLQLAVLSSFQWDEEWLLSKMDCARTKMILVAYAANDAEKAVIRSNAPSGLIRFCFPPMHGGYMHSKLQILKFEGHLRIVIPSGNLVPYDWGETGVLENMVFLIDLPRLDDAEKIAGTTETLFGNELRRFLQALGLDEKLVKSLDNYDFSETNRYGYCGLGSTVRSLGLATEDPVDVDYVAAGTICIQEKWWNSSTFPRELLRDCQGARKGLLLHSKVIFVRDRGRDGAVWAYMGSANLSESAWGRLVKDRDAGTAKLSCRNWECGVLVAVGKAAGTADSWARRGTDQGAQAKVQSQTQGHTQTQAQAQTQTHEGRDQEQKEKQQGEASNEEKLQYQRRHRHQHQDEQDESAGLDEAFGTTIPIPMKVPAGRYAPDQSAASRPWFFMKAD
ncbi:ubiquitin interaction domain-containing protein [Colletotrichum karsti]|uniref:Ubiquitin interaction domain-containing protein n=1 Tax=Colletotrichum karsti TaxID=1095194 RepID=A0A9P6LDS5_9PEZI|nr:ubiquitin interaction domain-containing protein [Colletotrichum karsti]KAF9869206.1 ubiquitin interaction domain-containing protein [Colletotrichum karsti]